MRYLAVGDIHGCMDALSALEDFVPFARADRLITLGDHVDRGPDSRAVLDWLIKRKEAGTLIPIRGNHELMMAAACKSEGHYDEWIACGGDAALRSYARSGSDGELEDIPDVHWRFVQHDCRPYFETGTHFFVQGNAYPDLPLDEQPDYMLYWEKFNDPAPHESGKIMVCGHTPQRDGLPRSIGHAICIDTHIYAGGWLTCLDVQTGEYWQANERRQVRAGVLDSDG